jgi:hypothetical protein
MTEIKVTCPRLNTLIQVDKLTKLVGYQILGLILGYVVAMHSVNGEWLNSTSEDKNNTVPNENSTVLDENSSEDENRTNILNLDSENEKIVSDFGENEEATFKPDSSGVLDFMNLICMSTPALNTAFKPQSVMECVESWLRYRPTSLQNISTKKIKSLLEDSLSILRYSEFLAYSLLECWIAATYSSQCLNTDKNDQKNETSVSGMSKSLFSMSNNYKNFVDDVLPLMDNFGEIFRKPTPPNNKKKGVYQTNQAEKVAADLLSRKAFFLLLYVLDDNRITVLKDLSGELKEYVSTYFD